MTRRWRWEPDNPEMLNNRALALQALGRDAEALAAADRALTEGAVDPYVMTIAGYILFQLGRVAEGFAILQRQARQVYSRERRRRGGRSAVQTAS